MIEYSEDKQFTTEELGILFSSVKWEEAKYPARLARSMQGFSLVISAREEGRLVGLLAAVDDGEMTAYLHYLLVAPDFQRRGIGRELLLRAHWRMPNTLYRAKYVGLFRAYGGTPRICKRRGAPYTAPCAAA